MRPLRETPSRASGWELGPERPTTQLDGRAVEPAGPPGSGERPEMGFTRVAGDLTSTPPRSQPLRLFTGLILICVLYDKAAIVSVAPS